MKIIRWEYKLLPQKTKNLDAEALQSRLNTLGINGWEYVSTTSWCNASTPSQPNITFWIFKRPAGYINITIEEPS